MVKGNKFTEVGCSHVTDLECEIKVFKSYFVGSGVILSLYHGIV